MSLSATTSRKISGQAYLRALEEQPEERRAVSRIWRRVARSRRKRASRPRELLGMPGWGMDVGFTFL